MILTTRKPKWLRKKRIINGDYNPIKKILKEKNLNTVCESASCPNRYECFSSGTATFMILGDICTRNCTFCGITKGTPHPPSEYEANNLANAVSEMKLNHVVITSVTRDDLIDGGAKHFANIINKIHNLNQDISIEVLIPDFSGNKESLKTVLDAKPTILNHNIETIERLYNIRPIANFNQSLNLLINSKIINPNIPTKSGLMLGLGEKINEIKDTILKIAQTKCDILTLGQYLPPTKNHEQLIKYIEPIIFKELEKFAFDTGFKEVFSGPFVRSSYHADKISQTLLKKAILI